VEQGIPINDGYSFGLFAPAGTPQPIVDKLRKALEEAKKNPENRKKIQEAGQEVYDGTWQDLSREMMEDSKVFGSALRTLGIELQ
jgi:tripartite-type tricarboxylate transporter receptor subunit TctC